MCFLNLNFMCVHCSDSNIGTQGTVVLLPALIELKRMENLLLTS